MSDELKVLGLFRDEAALRDHIADHLDDLELGLVVTKTEYPLNNPDGAGGRVDILALDEFDHVVVIELKRSDLSARATLHELAKYVTLLSTEARVPREAIRCIVLSTHWHELLLPLSFFAATSGVHVEGYKLVRADERVAYTAVELVPISDLPQFSPEFSVYQYLTLADRDLHMASIKGRAAELPFVRLVFVLLDAPKGSLGLRSGRRPSERVLTILPHFVSAQVTPAKTTLPLSVASWPSCSGILVRPLTTSTIITPFG